MFRKIIANISFSPALASQLGFYARRLRKEEATRRLGLIFTALALVVQSFVVFSPPEPANASSRSDFVPGGVRSIDEYLKHYDRNLNNIKDLYSQLGITREEISAAKLSTVNSKRDGVFSWGLKSRFSSAQGERVYTLYKDNGEARKFFYRPLKLWDTSPYASANGSNYNMYVGYSAKFGWFAIHKNCGNLITKKTPKAKAPNYRCSTITATQLTRAKYRFTFTEKSTSGASYKNATFTFGDGAKKSTTSRNIEHSFSKPGSYVVSVAPKFVVGGKTVSANSPNCKTTVNVEQAPQPVAQCDELTISRAGTIRTLDASSSFANGAKITGYHFVVTRDGAVVYNKSFASSQNSYSTSFDASEPGVYEARVTVKTSLGEKTSGDCAGSFTVAPPAVCGLNPSLLASDPACQPCPGDENLWIKDNECVADVLFTKKARNMTQADVDATTRVASASDRIVYVLTARNEGKDVASVDFDENLADVTEYAQVIDEGGGSYDNDAKTLSWPAVELQPGEVQARMFTVQLASTIPATARGNSDATSYDCRMINTFGNAVEINVDCPQVKAVESAVTELPQTGPTANLLLAGGLLAIVTYFYARSRQLNTEIRLIRRDINSKTI